MTTYDIILASLCLIVLIAILRVGQLRAWFDRRAARREYLRHIKDREIL